jgi:hypothetical protein
MNPLNTAALCSMALFAFLGAIREQRGVRCFLYCSLAGWLVSLVIISASR